MKNDLESHKSFSFIPSSAFRDHSSIALFSEVDDEDEQKNDMMSDTDDNSFIEIALDNPMFNHPRLDQDLDHLRISFSSSFPSNIPEIQPNFVADFIEPAIVRASAMSPSSSFSSSSVRLPASTFRSSSTGTCSGPVLGSESFALYESSRRRDHLPAFNPLVHTLLFSLEPPPVSTVDESGGDDHNNWEDNHMHRYRKSSKITTTTTTTTTTSGCNHNNNGIMKLLMIKLRAAKIRKLLTSIFAKPRGHINFSSNKGNDKSVRKKRLRQHNSKETLEYYDFGNDNVSITNDMPSYCYHHDDHQRVGYKSRALDVNLGAGRGVLEAVKMTKSSGRRNRKTSSCPSSIKSSPIHQGFAGDVGQFCGRENSIQAAIAHCKSSLSQSSPILFDHDEK